jgi:TRAP-type mannitol/chloroaromatic compound transport system permease large subunit
MKGVSPPSVTMPHIIRGAVPFLLLDLVAVAIIVFFPPIVNTLPNLIVG